MTNMLHFRGNRVVSQIFTNISFQFRNKGHLVYSVVFDCHCALHIWISKADIAK